MVVVLRWKSSYGWQETYLKHVKCKRQILYPYETLMGICYHKTYTFNQTEAHMHEGLHEGGRAQDCSEFCREEAAYTPHIRQQIEAYEKKMGLPAGQTAEDDINTLLQKLAGLRNQYDERREPHWRMERQKVQLTVDNLMPESMKDVIKRIDVPDQVDPYCRKRRVLHTMFGLSSNEQPMDSALPILGTWHAGGFNLYTGESDFEFTIYRHQDGHIVFRAPGGGEATMEKNNSGPWTTSKPIKFVTNVTWSVKETYNRSPYILLYRDLLDKAERDKLEEEFGSYLDLDTYNTAYRSHASFSAPLPEYLWNEEESTLRMLCHTLAQKLGKLQRVCDIGDMACGEPVEALTSDLSKAAWPFEDLD